MLEQVIKTLQTDCDKEYTPFGNTTWRHRLHRPLDIRVPTVRSTWSNLRPLNFYFFLLTLDNVRRSESHLLVRFVEKLLRQDWDKSLKQSYYWSFRWYRLISILIGETVRSFLGLSIHYLSADSNYPASYKY